MTTNTFQIIFINLSKFREKNLIKKSIKFIGIS